MVTLQTLLNYTNHKHFYNTDLNNGCFVYFKISPNWDYNLQLFSEWLEMTQNITIKIQIQYLQTKLDHM